jgi:type IV pilus assembly protein PilN
VATINLLPWRAELKEHLKQRFFIHLTFAAIFSLFLVFILHLIISKRLDVQLKRNVDLQNVVTSYDQKNVEVKEMEKQKLQLLLQINHVQQLSADRANIVRIFNELVRVMPPGVYLTSLKRNQSKITLTGEADSDSHVSELIRLIEKSYLFSIAKLTEINGHERESIKEALNEFIVEIQMQPETVK